jgi:hypothetical protein
MALDEEPARTAEATELLRRRVEEAMLSADRCSTNKGVWHVECEGAVSASDLQEFGFVLLEKQAADLLR